jgi:hypothetical protein
MRNADCFPIIAFPNFLLNFNILACRRLIRREFALHELSPLIETIFSSGDAGDMIDSLLGDDAQAFIDVVDEVRSTLTHRD